MRLGATSPGGLVPLRVYWQWADTHVVHNGPVLVVSIADHVPEHLAALCEDALDAVLGRLIVRVGSKMLLSGFNALVQHCNCEKQRGANAINTPLLLLVLRIRARRNIFRSCR